MKITVYKIDFKTGSNFDTILFIIMEENHEALKRLEENREI